jgi:MFS transporter, DHA2 family, multidrug resistance protein
MEKWIIAVTVVLCALIELIDTTIVNVALSQLMGNLGATLGEVSWVIAAYAIANVIVVPMASWLSQQFGRRNYYVASVLIFTLASFMCGHATSIWELVGYRFIQGLGGGALMATSQAILFDTFPVEQRGLASALFGLGVIVGPTVGPSLGGYIVDNYAWQWIFYINVPIGIVAALMAFTYVKNSKFDKKTALGDVDWLGIGLLIMGVGSLQLVLEQGEREAWFESNFIIAFSILAAIGLILFIVRELTCENPIVNLRILKNSNLAIGTVLSFVLGFGLFASVFVYPVFVQRILGFTALQTGYSLMPGALLTAFCMPMVGRLLQSGANPKYLIMMGFVVFATFTFWTSGILNTAAGIDDFYYPLLLRGMGMGLLFVPLTSLSLSTLAPKDIAQGSGLTSMMRQLGGSFSVAIVAILLEKVTQQHRTDLLSHLDTNNPALTSRVNMYQQGFIAKGFSAQQALSQAYAAIERTLSVQSTILSYQDVFMYVGTFFIICIPFVLLIRVKKNAPAISMGDAH